MKNKLKKDLSWEIEVLPVQIKGQTKVLNKALVRSDDQKLIGIRSRYYKPVFNRDLEAIKEKILNTGGFSFKGYEEFKRGKRILAFFENKKKYKLCGYFLPRVTRTLLEICRNVFPVGERKVQHRLGFVRSHRTRQIGQLRLRDKSPD